MSVSNNIAEGFERGTTAELLQFLYIARGSAGEVRSMLVLFERRPALVDFRTQISELKETLEEELTYRTQHLEFLREYLTVERERIINRLILTKP